jgi:hypothetical protein
MINQNSRRRLNDLSVKALLINSRVPIRTVSSWLEKTIAAEGGRRTSWLEVTVHIKIAHTEHKLRFRATDTINCWCD